jgi:hypothetical protein
MKVELRNLQGLVFKTFNYITSYAKLLEISSHTVRKRIKAEKPILFNNKEYYIKLIKIILI